MKIVVLGGGPAGLGAAWRLAELGYDTWSLYEKNDFWGGLSASFRDDEGFWWDIGGHVLFSHYSYFDQIVDNLFDADSGWEVHKREAWIWMQNRFIPYPLQNNIHRLPKEIYWECLQGIIELQKHANGKPVHFGEWIEKTFGAGLAKWFLRPYNFKVWAYPVEEMAWSWVGERVAPVDLKNILYNAVFSENSDSWGPNATFRFPKYGGTGAIWRSMAEKLPSRNLHLNKHMSKLDAEKHTITFSDGSSQEYDALLSTIPLTELLRYTNPEFAAVDKPALCYSGTHIVGVGLKGEIPEKLASKCWLYFPEKNCPFYRVTVFSNYSPNNVPHPTDQWSLMCEVSESSHKKVDTKSVVDDVINGLLNTGMVRSRKDISHTWAHYVAKGYPTPSLERDTYLFPVLRDLEKKDIYSRGRFGAWRYEVGNMDHSFMQGVECVNALLASGEELTLWYPNIVNSTHPSGRKR